MGIWRWAVGFSLLGSPLPGQMNAVWSRGVVGQLRFLYQHMRTEFAGCFYGSERGDTINVEFFIPSTTDPRTASDSMVYHGTCPDIQTLRGAHLVGLGHSHIRPGSLCYPSGRDQETLKSWTHNGAVFGAIMCAHGDSIVIYSEGAYGMLGVPPLDSLYRH